MRQRSQHGLGLGRTRGSRGGSECGTSITSGRHDGCWEDRAVSGRSTRAAVQYLHLTCGICGAHKLPTPRERPQATMVMNVPHHQKEAVPRPSSLIPLTAVSASASLRRYPSGTVGQLNCINGPVPFQPTGGTDSAGRPAKQEGGDSGRITSDAFGFEHGESVPKPGWPGEPGSSAAGHTPRPQAKPRKNTNDRKN
jgi:hypothetical protein